MSSPPEPYEQPHIELSSFSDHSSLSTASITPTLEPLNRSSENLLSKPAKSASLPATTSRDQNQNTSTSQFICTFCWQPQYAPSKPKLVGSSRISCTACWKEVLDLSICWVCGEQIVRGEEVVSLGWCFWHKACFGCLICGRALPVPSEAWVDVEQGECFGDEGKEKGKSKRKRKRSRAVELQRIPLCVDCGAEMEGKSEESVLERGLETVGKFDGGLSRSRLMRISEATEREREVEGLSMRWVSGLVADEGPCDSKRSKSEGSGIETTPLMASMDQESFDDDGPSHNDDIYVSVMDPLNEPAFRPSKTKPLPKWMSLLPNNRRQKRGSCPEGRHSHSITSPSKVIGLPILEFPTADTDMTPFAEAFYPILGTNSTFSPSLTTNIDKVIAPDRSTTHPESLEMKPLSPKSRENPVEIHLPPRPAQEQIESLTRRPLPTFGKLDNKNLSVTSKRKNPFARAGSTGTGVRFAPLEKTVSEERAEKKEIRPSLEPAAATSFPFFQNARQSITPAKESSWGAGFPSAGLQPFKGTPLESQSRSEAGQINSTGGPVRPPSRVGGGNALVPVQSAEFLDRYQPKTSPGVVRNRYSVGEVGSIIERFERRRERESERRRTVERMERGVEEVTGEERDKVKEVLRKELKSLFEGK